MARVALITGGSRGIGFGIAQHLADDGFNLAIGGRRSEDDVADALSALRARGVQVLYCQGDIGNAADRSRILGAIDTHFGALHVLVNNAGVAPDSRDDILEASEASFERLIRINLQGPYFLTQTVAKWMIRQRAETSDWRGCIINVGSISATVASVHRGDYCISKAGIGMATALWAARLGEFEIPVYELRPGITATDMTSGVKDKYDALLADGLCVQARWGEPADCGRAAAALARGDFGYSTGQVFHIDGGLTLPRL